MFRLTRITDPHHLTRITDPHHRPASSSGHDGHGSRLYATLAADEEVLEYDEFGNSTGSADNSDHLDFPASIATCSGRR